MIKGVVIILIIIILIPFIGGAISGFNKAYPVARISANEMVALASCKVMYEAFSAYWQVNGEYPVSLSILGSEKPPYLQKDLAKGIRQGYNYSYEKTASGFFVTASPLALDKTGRFYFSIDESKQILACDKDRHCMSEEKYLGSRQDMNYNDLRQR